jgi:hypothetical protein
MAATSAPISLTHPPSVAKVRLRLRAPSGGRGSRSGRRPANCGAHSCGAGDRGRDARGPPLRARPSTLPSRSTPTRSAYRRRGDALSRQGARDAADRTGSAAGHVDCAPREIRLHAGSSAVPASRSTWRHSTATASAGRAPVSAMNRHERPPPSALLGDLVDLGQRQRKDPLAADWVSALRRASPGSARHGERDAPPAQHPERRSALPVLAVIATPAAAVPLDATRLHRHPLLAAVPVPAVRSSGSKPSPTATDHQACERCRRSSSPV